MPICESNYFPGIISSLTCRFDSEKNHEAVGKVNTLLSEYFLSDCIISHINIKQEHLNRYKLHLNRHGNRQRAVNLLGKIRNV